MIGTRGTRAPAPVRVRCSVCVRACSPCRTSHRRSRPRRRERRPRRTSACSSRTPSGTDLPTHRGVAGGGGARRAIEALGPRAPSRCPPAPNTWRSPARRSSPGLIEGHSHLFLHPYNETVWTTRCSRSRSGFAWPRRSRMRRRRCAPASPLFATSAPGCARLRRAVEARHRSGIVPGPRMLVVTRAIVATGSYGPRARTTRSTRRRERKRRAGPRRSPASSGSQVGHGADWVKVYADYGWGPGGQNLPTFSQDELRVLVETARRRPAARWSRMRTPQRACGAPRLPGSSPRRAEAMVTPEASAARKLACLRRARR